jgi:hypothetical protein
LISILKLHSLHLCLSSVPFPSGLSTEINYEFIFLPYMPHAHMPQPSNRTRILTLTLMHEEYKLWSSSL